VTAVFDTNVLIYHLKDCLPETGQQLLARFLTQGAAYSVITRIELLGYPQPLPDLLKAKALLRLFQELPIDEAVIDCTISLRQQQRIKIPDALIAATALTQTVPLVTRNIRDFSGIDGLQLIDPFQL
jgi:toxin FitB